MSGRGLGFTGGTVDKLESLDGYRVTLEPQDFLEQVEKINVSIRKLNITKKGKFSPFGHEYYFFRDIQARITDNAISVTDDFCFTLTINAKKIIEWAGDFIIVLI